MSVERGKRLITFFLALCPLVLFLYLLVERRRLYEDLEKPLVSSGKPVLHSGYSNMRSRVVGGLKHLPWKETSHSGSNARKKVIIDNGEVENLVGFSFASIPPGGKVEKHVHESKVEVFHVQTGHGIVHVWSHPDHIEDQPEREQLFLNVGDTVIIFPKEEHEFINPGDKALSFLYFAVAVKNQ